MNVAVQIASTPANDCADAWGDHMGRRFRGRERVWLCKDTKLVGAGGCKDAWMPGCGTHFLAHLLEQNTAEQAQANRLSEARRKAKRPSWCIPGGDSQCHRSPLTGVRELV
jgi:hypothetical protein